MIFELPRTRRILFLWLVVNVVADYSTEVETEIEENQDPYSTDPCLRAKYSGIFFQDTVIEDNCLGIDKATTTLNPLQPIIELRKMIYDTPTDRLTPVPSVAIPQTGGEKLITETVQSFEDTINLLVVSTIMEPNKIGGIPENIVPTRTISSPDAEIISSVPTLAADHVILPPTARNFAAPITIHSTIEPTATVLPKTTVLPVIDHIDLIDPTPTMDFTVVLNTILPTSRQKSGTTAVEVEMETSNMSAVIGVSADEKVS